MQIYRKKRTLSPEKRKELQEQLNKRFEKPVRSGMSRQFVRGDELEATIEPFFKELSKQKTKDIQNLSDTKSKEIDQKVSEEVKRMENRMSTQFQYAVDKMEEKILLAIANMPKPRDGEDGKSPDKKEIENVVSETITRMMPKRDEKTGISLDDENDKNVLLDLIRKEANNIVKNRPTVSSGGGVTYAFQIKDMPNKTRGTGPTYEGNEGKTLVVSSDGKGFEFGTVSGGGSEVPSGTVDGSNTSFTVDNEPKLIMTENGNYVENNGYTITGSGPYTITLTIPPSQWIRSLF